jgi:hypothetical protein
MMTMILVTSLISTSPTKPSRVPPSPVADAHSEQRLRLPRQALIGGPLTS